MKEVTKDTIIGDILDICPDSAPLFLEIGMHCLGCPASRGELLNRLAPFTEMIRTNSLKR